MPAAPLVRAVFGMLVVATLGAFFVTQRLKTSTPIVERVFFHQYVSPNGDGRKDRVRLRFDLPERDRISVEMVDELGEPVRELAEDVPRGVDRDGLRWQGRTALVTWNGRTDAGATAPDGIYRMRVTLREEGRSITAPRELTLDTSPPRPAIVAVSPPTFVPGLQTRRGRVRVRFRGPQDPAPLFRVFRTDVAGPPRLSAEFRGPRFRQTAEWNGRDRRGNLVRDGIYAFSVTVEDKAGNRGSAPASLPPDRGSARARTGASARYLTAAGPLVPVRAGAVARITAGPIARRLRWNLSRAGGRTPIARGRGRGGDFGVRVPGDARTGLHLLRIQAGGRRATLPLVVRGSRRGRVLVVLPAITWQGTNAVDDDRDGFSDTLDESSSSGIERPFAHGRPPLSLETETIPILRLLDRERLAYDLTTDLALARGIPPGLAGRPGLIFPGSTRWLTERLDLALRDYVERGGRVASFGTDSFRRRVDVGAERLFDPSTPEVRNLFGEETQVEPVEPTSLVASTDRIGMFRGTDAVIGFFERVESSTGLAADARLVAAAGAQGRTAFVAYRLGRGLVIRAGAPDWGSQVFSRPEVGRVTRRAWELLSR